MGMGSSIRPLHRIERGEIEKASKVLAEAFRDDPDTSVLIPDLETRVKKLPEFFRFFVRFGLNYGGVYSPTENLEGISIWLHSSRMKMTFPRSLRSGILRLTLKMDGPTMKRFDKYGKDVEKVHEKVLDRQHWFLLAIGVDPNLQGMGYARKMLDPVLRRADRQGLPCYLDTDRKVNLRIYERFSFQVVKKYESLGNDHWAMVREPL